MCAVQEHPPRPVAIIVVADDRGLGQALNRPDVGRLHPAHGAGVEVVRLRQFLPRPHHEALQLQDVEFAFGHDEPLVQVLEGGGVVGREQLRAEDAGVSEGLKGHEVSRVGLSEPDGGDLVMGVRIKKQSHPA